MSAHFRRVRGTAAAAAVEMKKNRLMDHERKDYLGAMEKRLGAMETRLGANMVTKQDLERVDAKIDGAVQLLINEMSNRFGEVGQRLDRIELRLDRQAGLIQTGSGWIVRQNDWSERADVAQQEMQKQIHEDPGAAAQTRRGQRRRRGGENP